MAWMADIRGSEGVRGHPADGDHATVFGELESKRKPGFDLRFRGSAVGRLGAGMGRDDIPKDSVDPGLCECPVDDGGGRLRRACAGELALRRERDARDTRAAVARRLAHEQDRRVRVLGEIPREALTQQRRASAFPVEVPCRADVGAGEPVDE